MKNVENFIDFFTAMTNILLLALQVFNLQMKMIDFPYLSMKSLPCYIPEAYTKTVWQRKKGKQLGNREKSAKRKGVPAI